MLYHTLLIDTWHAGMVVVPSCVTRHTIQRLNEVQRPRLIYLVVPELTSCRQYLQRLAENVRCVDEKRLIPGVNKHYVEEALVRNYPGLKGKERRRAGWYLQQVSISAHAALHASDCLCAYAAALAAKTEPSQLLRCSSFEFLQSFGHSRAGDAEFL
jgi:hypothetical protein